MVKSNTVTLTIPEVPLWAKVSVMSKPVKGVPVTCDPAPAVPPRTEIGKTPVEFEVSTGLYEITVPATFDKATFVKWEDESTDPIRTIDITYPVDLIAYYKVPPPPARKLLPVVGVIAGGMAALIGATVLAKKRRS